MINKKLISENKESLNNIVVIQHSVTIKAMFNIIVMLYIIIVGSYLFCC